MKVIAFYNLKGGVGKTATAVNIAGLAAASGVPTLLWDLDAQGASTWYLSPANTSPREAPKAARMIKGKTPIGQLIIDSSIPRLDLIPADTSFRNLDLQMDRHGDKDTLQQWLAPLGEQYGLVILDCAPSLSLLAEQIFRAADRLYVPLLPTWLSMNSWEQLQVFFDDKGLKQKKLAPFFSMVDRRKSLHRAFLDNPPAALKRLLDGYIPYSSDVERMGEHHTVVEHFAPRSIAALAYRLMWQKMSKDLKL